jgi:hypothetical protein
MPDLGKILLDRMTHLANIPHILKHGITHANSTYANPNYTPIGDGSMIAKRNQTMLKNGRMLSEYIPFYFATRTPMLYVIQNGFNFVNPIAAEKIVCCVSSVQKIVDLQLEFSFTNGHAADSLTSHFTHNEVNNIENLLDWEAINAKYWKDEDDLDKKRRKEAEFLVLGDLPTSTILGYAVVNQSSKDRICEFGTNASLVGIRPQFYF